MNNSIKTSFFAGVLALALVITAMPTPSLYAATTTDLEAKIASLVAQVQQLQALLANQTASTPSINLTRNLTLGSTGSDVKALQQFLNSDPATVVALTGVGSKGNETTYFGPATQAAVVKFQNKYRSTILTPVGLVNGTGFVGLSTRAKINMLATQQTQSTTNTGSNTNTNTSSNTNTNTDTNQNTTATVSEEGDIEVTRGSEHTSTLDLTGDFDAIYSLEVKAEDSAMTINRIEFMFDKRPSRYIDSFVLYQDDTKIATIDSSASAITEVDDIYRLRFSSLSSIVEKDTKSTFTLEAKALDNLSGSREADTLSVYVPQNGVRAVDTAKYSTQEPKNQLASRTFDFRDAEDDGDITVRIDSDSPQSGILQVKEKTNTSDTTVMITSVEAEDSDITLKEMYVKVASTESVVSNVVRNLSLVFDGDTIAKESVMKNTGNAITGKDEDGTLYTIIDTDEYYVYFEDLDKITIDEDTREALTLKAEFYKQEGRYDNGTQVTFTVRSLEGENVNGSDIVNGNINTGSARTFTLYTDGLSFSFKDADASSQGTARRSGEFSLEFDVTAFGSDIYVPFDAVRQVGTTTTADVGAEYRIVNSAREMYTLGTANQSFEIKGAKEIDGYFRLFQGTTYRITLQVFLDNTGATENVYRTQLDAIRFKVGSTSGTEHTITDGFSDYRTGTTLLKS